MPLPVRLAIHDAAFALDGGTTHLLATDDSGAEHTIRLVQHAFPSASSTTDAIPGRLYYDGELVPMRSELEAGVLRLLHAATVRYTPPARPTAVDIQLSRDALVFGDDIRQLLTHPPDENIQYLVDRVVQFVESDQYLLCAERIEQAADPTRYDVRVCSDRDNRMRVIVRVAQLLIIGVQVAREMVDGNIPIAQGLTALEVRDLSEKCRVEGLDINVSPPFRWRLA